MASKRVARKISDILFEQFCCLSCSFNFTMNNVARYSQWNAWKTAKGKALLEQPMKRLENFRGRSLDRCVAVIFDSSNYPVLYHVLLYCEVENILIRNVKEIHIEGMMCDSKMAGNNIKIHFIFFVKYHVCGTVPEAILFVCIFPGWVKSSGKLMDVALLCANKSNKDYF